jgi:hypothetical protein
MITQHVLHDTGCLQAIAKTGLKFRVQKKKKTKKNGESADHLGYY